MTKSTASHHLKTLRDAGIIGRARGRARASTSALRRDELDRRFPGLLDSVLRAANAEQPAAAGSRSIL